MANRQLSSEELANIARPFIAEVRRRLTELSAGDADLHWALRRKLAKELTYDERTTPMERRALKAFQAWPTGKQMRHLRQRAPGTELSVRPTRGDEGLHAREHTVALPGL